MREEERRRRRERSRIETEIPVHHSSTIADAARKWKTSLSAQTMINMYTKGLHVRKANLSNAWRGSSISIFFASEF